MRARISALLGLLLALMALPALAQSSNITIDDDGCGLNKSQLTTQAQKLVDRGAKVVVICTADEGGDAYLDRRLDSLGVASSSNASDIPAQAIIYYVGTNPRVSTIISGSSWTTLNDNALNALRLDFMNPMLQAGDYNAAFANTIEATANRVGTQGSSGGSTTTVVETEGLTPVAWACLAAVVLGAIGAFTIPPFMRRRNQQQAALQQLTEARNRYEASRKAAGASIADLGQILKDAELKQQFDVASYGQATAQQLQQQQAQAAQLAQKAQHDFDDLEERLQLLREPGLQDYQSAAAGYEGIKATADASTTRLRELDQRRKELDNLGQQAQGDVDRLKKF